MSVQKYIQEFKDIIKVMPWWSNLENSQFVSGMANFVGQVVYRTESFVRRRLQEAFLSTATKRASILAAAEDKGYVGRRISPSWGNVEITNLTDSPITIPLNTPLISNAPLDYVTMAAVDLPARGKAVVRIEQLKLRTFTSTMDVEGEKFKEFALPKDITKITHSIDVWVSDTESSAAKKWTKSFMFRKATKESEVYTEFYRATEQLGIRFGNGHNGRIPPAGASIYLDAWTTSGITTLIQNQPLKVFNDDALNEKISIVTLTSISGGNEAESTEEIRRGALYVTPYDEQIVWADDYQFFIRSKIGGITWIKVWGEQQQEKQDGRQNINNINTVFISAYAPNIEQGALGDEIKRELDNTTYLNKRYRFVTVKDYPIYIDFKGWIMPDKDKIQTKNFIIEKLNELYSKDSTNRPASWFEKDIWTMIDAMEIFTRFELTIRNPPPETLKLNEYVFMVAEEAKAGEAHPENFSTYDIEYEVRG